MHTTTRLGSLALAVIMALGIVLGLGGPSQAQTRHHDGAVRRDAPVVVTPRAVDGFRHHHHHHFRHHPFFVFAPVYGFAPSYAPIYWYCPVYRAYYPTVTYCPVPWVSTGGY